jgi:hypothetical protein
MRIMNDGLKVLLGAVGGAVLTLLLVKGLFGSAMGYGMMGGMGQMMGGGLFGALVSLFFWVLFAALAFALVAWIIGRTHRR